MSSSRALDAFVDGLASGEAFFGAMPVGDFFFSEFPTQQDDFAFDFAGEVEESDVEVFDLHAGGVNFGDGIFDALQRFLALGLTAGELRDVDECSAIEEDAVPERFEFSVDFFDELLAIDGRAEQGFEHGEKHAGFVEGKSAGGHLVLFYSARRFVSSLRAAWIASECFRRDSRAFRARSLAPLERTRDLRDDARQKVCGEKMYGERGSDHTAVIKAPSLLLPFTPFHHSAFRLRVAGQHRYVLERVAIGILKVER
jgi:hypothetical protein